MATDESEVRQELTLQDEVQAFAARVAALPLRVAFNDHSNDEPRFGAFFAAWPYITGEYPFHRAVHVSPVPAETVLPTGCAVVCQSIQAHNRRSLIVGIGYIANVAQWAGGSLHATICARTDEIAESLVREFESHRVEQATDLSVVDVTFTYLGAMGANRTVRRIDVPRWPEIARNTWRRSAGPSRMSWRSTRTWASRDASCCSTVRRARARHVHPGDRVGVAVVVRNGVRDRSRRALCASGVHVRRDVGRRR